LQSSALDREGVTPVEIKRHARNGRIVHSQYWPSIVRLFFFMVSRTA
jgi:hypothetical protein